MPPAEGRAHPPVVPCLSACFPIPIPFHPQYILETEQVDTVLHFAAQTHVDNSFGNSLAFTINNTCARAAVSLLAASMEVGLLRVGGWAAALCAQRHWHLGWPSPHHQMTRASAGEHATLPLLCFWTRAVCTAASVTQPSLDTLPQCNAVTAPMCCWRRAVCTAASADSSVCPRMRCMGTPAWEPSLVRMETRRCWREVTAAGSYLGPVRCMARSCLPWRH